MDTFLGHNIMAVLYSSVYVPVNEHAQPRLSCLKAQESIAVMFPACHQIRLDIEGG